MRKYRERMNGLNVYVSCAFVFYSSQSASKIKKNWLNSQKSSTARPHKCNVSSRECRVFTSSFSSRVSFSPFLIDVYNEYTRASMGERIQRKVVENCSHCPQEMTIVFYYDCSHFAHCFCSTELRNIYARVYTMIAYTATCECNRL